MARSGSPDERERPVNPHLSRMVVLALAAMLVAGCGRKGDLYLPDQGQSQPHEVEKGSTADETDP